VQADVESLSDLPQPTSNVILARALLLQQSE